jgi:hypothetical protein
MAWVGVTPAFRCPITEQLARAPRVQLIRPLDLFFVDDRHKRLGTEEHHRPVEGWRCDPNNRVRMFVEPDHAPHHAGIVLKVRVPVGVAQHQVRRAVRTVLVSGVKEAAKIRLNVQRVEVVAGDEIEPPRVGLSPVSRPAIVMSAGEILELWFRSRRST